MVETPEISPVCVWGIRLMQKSQYMKFACFLTNGSYLWKIKGWGKLLKRKPPPFCITKRVSKLYRKTENAVVPFRNRGMSGYFDTAVEKFAKLRYNVEGEMIGGYSGL